MLQISNDRFYKLNTQCKIFDDEDVQISFGYEYFLEVKIVNTFVTFVTFLAKKKKNIYIYIFFSKNEILNKNQ